MAIDRFALATGSIRLASGISFLVDPLRANRLWGAVRRAAGAGEARRQLSADLRY